MSAMKIQSSMKNQGKCVKLSSASATLLYISFVKEMTMSKNCCDSQLVKEVMDPVAYHCKETMMDMTKHFCTQNNKNISNTC